MRYGIALDIGTSGFRCQAIDLDTGSTVSTSITERHPIPGMNVIDHVNYAMKKGEDTANALMIGAINNLFASLEIDLSKVEKVAVCGNPFQLSLFQNIEIRDLAYAGKKKLERLGVVSPPRNGDVVKASDLGLAGMPDAYVTIPPAVTHEIGADALAMMLTTDILSQKEPCIVVDYGTNAEMALVVDGMVYTGSAASGPALEGQQISRGMLAAPGAISAVEIAEDGWTCYVLDDTMAPVEGDTVDPISGKIVRKGPMHGKSKGITGTGVVAALAAGIDTGLIRSPKILTEDGTLHLQDGVDITSKDVEEAGKAIGALRAGFLTLLDYAKIWIGDVKRAYMSGASGLYVDARKALGIGMVVPGAKDITQFGNTSITLARRIVVGDTDLDSLRDFAKQLKSTHCMFASSEFFKNLYGIEYSLWCSGMPMSEYNGMCAIYDIKPIPVDPDLSDVSVRRVTVRDLPDTEGVKVRTIPCGMILKGEVQGCVGCGQCVSECPENAISIEECGKSFIASIRSDRCGGTACRRCEKSCPEGALDTLSLSV
jgi:methylamine methyltransferase corrinoid protein reductive activase